MEWLNPVRFKRPRLALAAVITLIFVLGLVTNDHDHTQKFAFYLATGAGTYFVVTAAKAIRNSYGNLSVVMFAAGLAMVFLAIEHTPGAVFAGNALDGMAAPTVGALGGMFTSVEDED